MANVQIYFVGLLLGSETYTGCFSFTSECKVVFLLTVMAYVSHASGRVSVFLPQEKYHPYVRMKLIGPLIN